jgi:nucleotide-binding universal stress UspA family protein
LRVSIGSRGLRGGRRESEELTMTAAPVTPGTDTAFAPDELYPTGPVIVATDGTTSADAAVRAAMQLTGRSGASVVVLGVLEPMPLVAADYGLLLPPTDADDARRTALLGRLKAQVLEIAGPGHDWTIEMKQGDPATVVARTALDLRARVILLGIGHHDVLDRLFGGEVALHTLRLSRVPVLAVGATFKGLPTRAIIATDFSAASVRAARAALELFDTLKMVYLVHVAPRLELQPEEFAAWMTAYGEGVEPAFARMKAELNLPRGVAVETLTLQGKPSKELIELARSSKADIVVTGSRGAGLIDRILVGSTATGLIRGATCSIFAVPAPLGGGRAFTVPEVRRVPVAEPMWAQELEAFTRRNAGRRATLEVDDPDFGAQLQEHDYPFLGAAYDRHDERVEIMLGDFEGVRRHLTRGISNIRAIDVIRDEHGRDWMLRIAHGGGQTLLTFAV